MVADDKAQLATPITSHIHDLTGQAEQPGWRVAALRTADNRDAGWSMQIRQLLPVTRRGMSVAAICGAELPRPWLRSLVADQLRPAERHALMCCSRGCAAAVLHHCQATTLTLNTGTHLARCSIARHSILSLAASCARLHLRLQQLCIPLDTPAVWPSITHLSLCDVPLNSTTISQLHLQHLTNLRKLALLSNLSHFQHLTQLDVAALGKVLQAGGLAALRSLQLHQPSSDHNDEFPLLQALTPLLGNRITQLHLHTIQSLASLHQWPSLTHLVFHLAMLAGQTTMTAAAAEQLFSHPTLRCISLHGCLSEWPAHADCSSRQCSLARLQLACDTTVAALSRLPLHSISRVRICKIAWGYDSREAIQQQAIAQLSGCPKVIWQAKTPGDRLRSIPTGLERHVPIFGLLGWCTQMVALLTQGLEPAAQAALVLLPLDQPWKEQVGGLAAIAPTVHRVCLLQWRLPLPDVGTELEPHPVTWLDVVDGIPAHVTHLTLTSCEISREQLLPSFQHMHERGLHLSHLTLAYQDNTAQIDTDSMLYQGELQWLRDAEARSQVVAAATCWCPHMQVAIKCVA